MNLSIVIPVRNDADRLNACLRSIRAAAIERVSFEIVVVDNGSSDDSVAVADSYGAIVLVEPDATIAKLRNIGAGEASGEVLAFLDSDCTVSISWFSRISGYLGDETISCFGCPPGVPVDASWVQRCWYQIRIKDLYVEDVFHIEWLESMNLLVRRESFDRIGGFDEEMITCEDFDLCKRLSGYGSVVCDNRIAAIHHGEAETLQRFYQKERWRGTSNLYSLIKNGFDLTELPSVALPVIQVCACVVVVFALLLSMVGLFPLKWWFLGVAIWQVPLLLLSVRKNERPGEQQQVTGIYLLLNVYFLARGLSLFSADAWLQAKRSR